MKSLALWREVAGQYSDWEAWLNKKGNDGTLVDTDDNVSFIDRSLKKAIKINHEPEYGYDFEYWISDFDTDVNKITVLNVIFNNYEVATNKLPEILKEFIG